MKCHTEGRDEHSAVLVPDVPVCVCDHRQKGVLVAR